MDKRIILLIVMFMLLSVAARLYADDFMIGAYSSLRSFYYNFKDQNTRENTDAVNEALVKLLSEAGFNTAKVISAYSPDDALVENLFAIMAKQNVTPILEDIIFAPELGKLGNSALSAGNYMRFEAEISAKFTLPNLEEYYYSSQNRKGEASFTMESDLPKHSWKLPNGVSGYAYNDIVYLWKIAGTDNRYRIGPEFRFLDTATYGSDSFVNKLSVKFVFKVQGIENLAEEAVLADFSLGSFYDFDNPKKLSYTTADTTFRDIPHYYKGKKSLNTRICKADLPDLLQENSVSRLYSVTLTIPIDDLYAHGVTKQSGWYQYLSNLSPRMYWHGKGDLYLDYVDIFDDIYAEYTSKPDMWKAIRRFDFKGKGIMYYGVDEPKSPHYRSFSLLQKANDKSKDASQIITALNFDRRDIRKNASGEQAYFRSTDNFIREVPSDIVMIDRYPFTGASVQWHDAKAAGFVQNHLDYVMREYDYYRKLIDNDITKQKFICVTQTFGEYNQEAKKWTYLQTPDKMAKCLQLLPLCYKADGVMSYEFDTVDANRFASVKHSFAKSDNVLSPLYDAIRQANMKLKVYGNMLRPYRWIGAKSIMPGANELFIKWSLCDDLSVFAKDKSGLYQGYIQSALYLDKEKNPVFVAVNRRTTQVIHPKSGFSAGVLDQVDPHKNDFHAHYKDAPPQYLQFQISREAEKRYGTAVALYDPYDQKLYHPEGTKIVVELDAGDAKLLQMVGTLPAVVTENREIKHKLILEGEIRITDKSRVIVHPGTEILIRKGSRITIDKGAALLLKGVTTREDDVQINVKPGAEFSEA